jgi:hypothetical protein
MNSQPAVLTALIAARSLVERKFTHEELVAVDSRLAEIVLGNSGSFWDKASESTKLAVEFNPSANIGHAWMVMEKLGCLLFEVSRENCMGVRYDASCYYRDDLTDKVRITADTAPMAISVAALKMVYQRAK